MKNDYGDQAQTCWTHRHKRYMSAVVYEASSHQPVRAD